MKQIRTTVATLALGAATFAVGAAFVGPASVSPADAQSTANASPAPGIRGERRSAYDIARVERRLKRMIDQLQHDQRDYAGHRVAAIKLLGQADAELEAALQTDATTPR